jgi:hypothetical protein
MLDGFQNLLEVAVIRMEGFPAKLSCVTCHLRSRHRHHSDMLTARSPDIRVSWTKDRHRWASKRRGEMR